MQTESSIPGLHRKQPQGTFAHCSKIQKKKTKQENEGDPSFIVFISQTISWPNQLSQTLSTQQLLHSITQTRPRLKGTCCTHGSPGDCWLPPVKPCLSTCFSSGAALSFASRPDKYQLLFPFSVSFSATPGESCLLP